MSDIKIVLPINEKEYIRDCQLMYDKGRVDERERIIEEILKHGMETVSGLDVVEMQRAIEIVRGE